MDQPPPIFPYPPNMPPPLPQQKWRFGLSWWGVIPVLGLIAVDIIFRHRVLNDPNRSEEFRRPEFDIGYFTGQVIGCILLSLLVSWIICRIAQAERLVATSIFSVVMCLGILSVVAPTHPRIVNQIVKSEVDQLWSKRHASDTAIEHLKALGGVAPKGLDAPGALDDRLAAVDDVVKATTEMLDAGDTAEQSLNDTFRQRGLSQRDIDDGLRAYRAESRWDTSRIVFATNRTIFGEGHDLLDLLRTHRRDWQVDPLRNKLIFSDTKILNQYNTLLQQMKTDADAQGRMMATTNPK